MQINIDLSYLLHNQFPVNAYIIAECIYRDRLDLLTRLIPQTNANFLRMGKEFLLDNEFVKDNEVTDKYLNLFYSPEDQLFNTWWEAYPSKSPKGRILRTNQKVCWDIYRKLVGKDKAKADQVLRGLLEQIKQTTPQSAEYFQQSPAWLRSETWKDYLKDSDSRIAVEKTVVNQGDNDEYKFE